jgi:peptide/nickel transport system substrate-binding protein
MTKREAELLVVGVGPSNLGLGVARQELAPEVAVAAGPDSAAPGSAQPDSAQPVSGGTASWACHVGFPPSTIFPFTPPERMGIRNLFEFQTLMYRPLYWLGRGGQPGVDYDLSLADPPEWSDDGRSVTVTLKPWKWSNGENICADNVMFWINMMVVKGSRYGGYSPGYLPDNLTSYQKVAEDKVRFDFDRVYSKTWVLMNQLTLITPMPRAWDRTAHDASANASADLTDIPAVYDYLVAQNGEWTQESNEFRTTWPSSPVWSVVNGPWRLQRFELDGTVTFVPNEHYCGPNKPYLDEFRQVPTSSDEAQYRLIQAGPRAPGALQVGFLPHGLPPEPPEHYRLVPQEIYQINYLLLNFGNPTVAGRLIRQPYVRQALQRSLDQDTAIRDIFHGYGYRTSGPVPAVPDSDRISPAQRSNTMRFDIQRARQLLADHGWDVSRTPAVCVRPGAEPGCAGEGINAGNRLSFTVRYAEGRVALTQLMHQFRRDAAKAGIELRLQEVNGSVLVAQDHGEDGPENPHLWELQCWNGGWVFYGHPTGEVLFKTGAGSNYGRYSDPKADELIDSTVVSDGLDAFYAYQDYIAEQVPVIWTPGFPLRVFAVDNNLRGFEPVNPYGMINPENWYYAKP